MSADSLESLCAAHAPVADGGRFAAGTVFGDWRLTAFIGRGGNGEVYCAEHVSLGTPAAVKVLTREEDRAKERFEREARLLAQMKSKSFPRFFAYGEANGAAYIAMELLEPGELPTGDRAVAKFMLKVCEAVGELHALGCVHRDIKPGNILWRNGRACRPATADGSACRPATADSSACRPATADGRACRPATADGRVACSHAAAHPVLSDLGLVKEIKTSDFGLQTFSLTVVDGHRHGVGTPGYGAPEQMERGEATEASDIHALGVLADQCFGGRPPRAWKRIIERATSSIPAYRYQSVAALAQAIRRRHWIGHALAGFCCVSALLAAGVALREPVVRLWTQWREWRNAPVLNASAVLDGREMRDVRWYLDDMPIVMPHRFGDDDGGKRRMLPRRLCAVASKDGKTYSAIRAGIVPLWTGQKNVSLSLGENPEKGTAISIWMSDGTPFDFVWCPPEKDEAKGLGFWVSPKRLTRRQFESFLGKDVHRLTAISSRPRHDLSPDTPVQLGFNSSETVPIVSVPEFGITLEPPDVLQWRRGILLADDWDGDVAEWAGVPPGQGDGDYRGGGWMKMDGSGKEKAFGNFTTYDWAAAGTACVRYIAVSRFQNERNTVRYCTAQTLLRSEKTEDVAKGEEMLKGFFQSEDMELRMLAMECCIERGIMTLEDLGGTNAAKRLRFAAVRRGDLRTLELLATGDPDPDVRKEAYGSMENPPPMVTARYIAQIRAEDAPGDIAKPMNAVWSMTDRKALEFIVEHSLLKVFRVEAYNRLNNLGE